MANGSIINGPVLRTTCAIWRKYVPNTKTTANDGYRPNATKDDDLHASRVLNLLYLVPIRSGTLLVGFKPYLYRSDAYHLPWHGEKRHESTRLIPTHYSKKRLSFEPFFYAF